MEKMLKKLMVDIFTNVLLQYFVCFCFLGTLQVENKPTSPFK
jgi:hypothetical protein